MWLVKDMLDGDRYFAFLNMAILVVFLYVLFKWASKDKDE